MVFFQSGRILDSEAGGSVFVPQRGGDEFSFYFLKIDFLVLKGEIFLYIFDNYNPNSK